VKEVYYLPETYNKSVYINPDFEVNNLKSTGTKGHVYKRSLTAKEPLKRITHPDCDYVTIVRLYQKCLLQYRIFQIVN
jgi:hypothetical protein